MSEWLDDLRKLKGQAFEDARSKTDRVTSPHASTEQQLMREQNQILTLMQNIQVEPLLQQLLNEILKDHPWLSNPSLIRTVISRSVSSAADFIELAPWSGPLENNLLPESVNLPEGRFIVEIGWKLQQNYSAVGSRIGFPGFQVSITAFGVQINGQGLSKPTSEEFKSGVLRVFRSALQPRTGHRPSRRHHRPWYKRLWRLFFPDSQPKRLYLVIALAMVVLAIVLGIFVAQAVANSAFIY